MSDVLFGARAGRVGPDGRRAVLLAVCVVASLAVQAGAWRAAAAVIGRETAGGHGGVSRTHSLWIGAVETGPVEATAGKPEAHPNKGLAAEAPPATDSRSPIKPSPPALLARPTEGNGDDNGLDRPRFYSYREVDIPAEPVAEWNLEPAALDSLATSRIVFTLLVGSDGTVLHCSVDEPERLPFAARLALEARLKQTAMRPARRGGVAVASRRRVELFTEGGV